MRECYDFGWMRSKKKWVWREEKSFGLGKGWGEEESGKGVEKGENRPFAGTVFYERV